MEIALCDNCNREIRFSIIQYKQNRHGFMFCSIYCSSYHRLFNAIRKNRPSPLHPFRHIRWLKRFSDVVK